MKHRYIIAALFAVLLSTTSPVAAKWHGGAANAVATELDAVPNLYAVCGAAKVLSTYNGPLYQVTRDSDGVTTDVYPALNGWPDLNVLVAFSGGSSLLRTICYDQTGNGRTLVSTVATSPYLNTDGAHPVFATDGTVMIETGNSALLPFTNNVSGASLILVRQAESLNATTQTMVKVSAGTGGLGAASRVVLRIGVNNKTVAGGSVLDGSPQIIAPGFIADTDWHVEVGTWNFATATLVHTLDTVSETASFGTGSNTSSTNSLSVTIAANINSGGYFHGKYSVIAFVSGVVSPETVATVVPRLAARVIPSKPANNFLAWPANASLTGPYTLAPGVSLIGPIQVPNGNTPDLSDPASMRYAHHTRVGVEPSNGRIFVCHSANPVNEPDTGMFPECLSSLDAGVTWTAPVIAMPPQSPFLPAGGATSNGIIVFPRNMQVFNGKLYFIVDAESAPGLALLAILCNPDGTFGTPVVISPGGMWTPWDNTFPTYAYDPVLAAALYPYNIIHGEWQGTQPQFTGLPLSPWTGTNRANGSYFVEPGTVTLADGTNILLWRKGGLALQHNIWIQTTKDATVRPATPTTMTSLPNAPSSVAAIMLSNGHLAVVANPGNSRTVLYIALFDGVTGAFLKLYAVAQGLPNGPTFPGIAKSGGPSYTGLVESSLPNGVPTLYISMSSHGKEWVYLATIPVAGL